MNTPLNREMLVASLIANADGRAPLEDEDFDLDREGDWVKETHGWSNVTCGRYWARAQYPLMLTFSPYTSEEGRRQLTVKYEEELNEALKKYDDRVAELRRHKIITTGEYRLVRWANRRADEIINNS